MTGMEPYAAMMIAGTLLSTATTMQAAKVEKEQYEHQRDVAELQGLQEEERRRQQLADALGTTNAIRAARGLDLDSPTGASVAGRLRRDAEKDIASIRIQSDSGQFRSEVGASSARVRQVGAAGAGAARVGGTLFDVRRSQRETT